MNMNINNMGVLEYMTIAEFTRKMVMDRYKLGVTTKEDTIKKLEILDNTVQEGLNTLLEAYNIFPDSNDQKRMIF